MVSCFVGSQLSNSPRSGTLCATTPSQGGQPMAIQPAPNQFASMPQRRYAQPGSLHVSLGGPIRRIIWVVLVVAWGLLTLRLYGTPTANNITGAVAFIIGLIIISIFTPGIRVAAQWEK